MERAYIADISAELSPTRRGSNSLLEPAGAAHALRRCIHRTPRRSDSAQDAELSRCGNTVVQPELLRDPAVHHFEDSRAAEVSKRHCLDAVNAALELARERRSSSDEMRSALKLYGTLTDREREVMQRVVKGLLNKEIAGELAIAEITVKAHRASLMRKMGVRRVPDLVRFAEMLARDDRD